MGIATKNRRKIIFEKQEFYWWVKPEYDRYAGMLEISIASKNKKFLVKYYAIQQQETNRYISVIGSEFPGLEKMGINSNRFICPDFVKTFENHGIGPKNIKSILAWCLDSERDLVPVNHKGEILGQ